MAQFNPDVQDLSGEWGRESKSISQKDGDRSLGVALSGAGTVLSSAVGVADTAVKDYLKENVRNDVELERDRMTNAVNLGLDIYAGKLNPEVDTLPQINGIGPRQEDAQKPMSLLDGGTKVPAALSDLQDRVQTVQNAREARKIPDVYYQSQLSAIAKSYRNRFPGYADYIDNIVSGVTGMDPANAYIKSVLGLLQAAQSGATDDTKSTLSMIDKYINLPHMDQVRSDFVAGKISSGDVRSYVNKFEVPKWESEENNRRLSDLKNNVEQRKILAERRVQGLGAEISNKWLSSNEFAAGKTLEQTVNDPALLNDPRRMAELVPMVLATKQTALRDFDAQVNKSYEGGVGSMAVDVGEKVSTYRNQTAQIFDDIADALQKGQAAKASVLANAVKSAGDKATIDLLNFPGLKVPMELALVGKNMPDQIGNIFFTSLYQSSKDLAPEMKNYMNYKLKNAFTQPNVANGGPADTLANDVKEMKAKGVASKQLFDILFDAIDHPTKISLTNENIPLDQKVGLAKYFFSPEGRALLNEFSGVGVNNLFARLTKGDVTDVMEQLGKKDPALWQNYKDFVTTSFANNIFRKEVVGLRNYQDIPGTKLTWNTDNRIPKWELVDLQPRSDRNTALPVFDRKNQIDAANKFINRLNYGLAQVWDTLSRDKEEVVPYLMDVFQSKGLDLLKTQGLPKEMYDSLKSEALKKKLEQQQREESSRQR